MYTSRAKRVFVRYKALATLNMKRRTFVFFKYFSQFLPVAKSTVNKFFILISYISCRKLSADEAIDFIFFNAIFKPFVCAIVFSRKRSLPISKKSSWKIDPRLRWTFLQTTQIRLIYFFRFFGFTFIRVKDLDL